MCCITIQGITSSYDERSVNQYIFNEYLKGTVYSSQDYRNKFRKNTAKTIGGTYSIYSHTTKRPTLRLNSQTRARKRSKIVIEEVTSCVICITTKRQCNILVECIIYVCFGITHMIIKTKGYKQVDVLQKKMPDLYGMTYTQLPIDMKRS